MSRVFAVLFLMLVLVGCNFKVEREADLRFFRIKTNEQILQFRSYSIDEQYRLMRVGNENVHPPQIHLINEFAKNGEPAVALLVARLKISDEDLEVRDIIAVLDEMNNSRVYIASSHPALMSLARERVGAMKGIWKPSVEKVLKGIGG
ncbi:hypothetical protein LJR118_001773 [Acidovorax sp. LjRoot118]|uniref:hypothetical protein n=1 Tax=unclassified Acidovorax TaxID=2684926 RepID=UPI000A4D1833|nr:hypothetical protein [Acidovorax sp. Root219]